MEPAQNWPWLHRLKERATGERFQHPERPHSTRHFRALGERYFERVTIEPFGAIDPLLRMVPGARRSPRVRRAALDAEQAIPRPLFARLAFSQRIEYARPR